MSIQEFVDSMQKALQKGEIDGKMPFAVSRWDGGEVETIVLRGFELNKKTYTVLDLLDKHDVERYEKGGAPCA